MKHFVGIDLGTTNSAICSYDGTDVHIWKSPEQNDVTPSAIFMDRRGNKFVGKRAYDTAPHSPDNSALLFKRLMGTSTPIQFAALNMTKTPEECSAEVLKVLFGYLKEEIRNDPETGAVITVPAAFNQMQKDATMQAASMAGIGMVALMQEPVAAVMSVMRARNADGMFLIYDLGGGTLDIAIAESISGRVNLIANGGIAMCGGRDFDRMLVDNVVKPWLVDKFNLPPDLGVNPTYKSLLRLAAWAAERAKIELSSSEEAVIGLSESEARVRDIDGSEIYLDIPITRATYDSLIGSRVEESLVAARETLSKAGLSSSDLERIVFVGGPTHYKPLRDKVSFELGIPGSTDVNPMTAVAEGAAVFAESIDWTTQSRSRKSSRGQITSDRRMQLGFGYIARTPGTKARIAVQLQGAVDAGTEFQIDSIDTGWTSGRIPLVHGATVDVILGKMGENGFRVLVFDAAGGAVALSEDHIVITRTAAAVEAIPASYSIGIEVLEKLGGRPTIEYLVRANDPLPTKGQKLFKAAESLKAGSSGSINLKMWEGEIEDPVTDNRPVGVLKISGSDFDDGVIPAGADILCDFEVRDSGNIVLEVSIPSIGGTFHSGRNFYSRQEGQMNYMDAAAVVADEARSVLDRAEEMETRIVDDRLDEIREKLDAASMLEDDGVDTENTQEAMERVLEAKRLLAQVRKEHLAEIRQMDLDHVVEYFDKYVRANARPSEANAFDNLAKTAQRCIDRNDKDFDNHLDQLRGKNWEILWRQDWFVVERFKWQASVPHLHTDNARFVELVRIGQQYMKSDNIDGLRDVVQQLSLLRIGSGPDDGLMDQANIVRG